MSKLKEVFMIIFATLMIFFLSEKYIFTKFSWYPHYQKYMENLGYKAGVKTAKFLGINNEK